MPDEQIPRSSARTQEQTDQERHLDEELTRLKNRIADLELTQAQLQSQRKAQGTLLKALCHIVAHENVKLQAMAAVHTRSAEVMLEPLRELAGELE